MDFETFAAALTDALPGEFVVTGTDQRLVDDLDWDSFQLVAAAVWVERVTGTVMPEELLGSIVTVGDLHHIYNAYASQRKAE